MSTAYYTEKASNTRLTANQHSLSRFGDGFHVSYVLI